MRRPFCFLLCTVAGIGAAMLPIGCSGNAPTLEQPVGMTHDWAPPRPPPPPPEDIDPEVALPVVGTDSDADLPEGAAEVYYRRCDLPDTPDEAPQFPFDGAALSERGMQILEQVAKCMLRGELRDEKIIVLGYADPVGSEAYNLFLALRRAHNVRDFLIRKGVPSHRISIASRGEVYARGHGPETWQFDRRVEIELDTGEINTDL